jgi:hypothetical protein
MMIMNQTAVELCRLEERKQVRRAQVIVDQKVREKKRREKEQEDTVAMAKLQTSGGYGRSPTKGGYGEQSQFSGSNRSPTKTMYGSPKKGGAPTETDRDSVMTKTTMGVSSPMKGGS